MSTPLQTSQHAAMSDADVRPGTAACAPEDTGLSSPVNPSPTASDTPKRWQVIGSSVCGASHEKYQQPCQDAHSWELLPSGVLVATVADGAGSAPHSAVGATIATQTVVATLQTHHRHHPWPEDEDGWRDVFHSTFSTAREAIVAEAHVHQQSLHNFATTLILVVATSHLVAAAQIGDGAAVVADEGGNLRTLTVPQHGEFINEALFLTSDNMVASMQVQVWRGCPRYVALFTDGLERLVLSRPENTPHAPFFQPVFHFTAALGEVTAGQEHLARFLRSDRMRGRSDDDLTLLLAAYVEG